MRSVFWIAPIVLLLLLTSSFATVRGDLYIHNPHGSCNRLRDNNEQNNRERDNANRLFDSQDNNRGGYEAPTYGMGSYYFYEQSILYIEWTAQHSCHNPESQCDFIIQYMCDNSGLVRDGTNAAIQGQTTTIPTTASQCINGNCDGDIRYGRHESLYYYQNCMNTVMNYGLFHADQDIFDNDGVTTGGSTHTRQDNNGQRYGYECPEERDYYPWWRPSPWKDIAIVTNTPAKCAQWQAQSQNRMAKYQCTYPNGIQPGTAQAALINQGYAYIPITQEQCESLGSTGANYYIAPTGTNLQNVRNSPYQQGVWTPVPSWGIPPPDCVSNNLWMSDNNLGNDISGNPMSYNWTVPSDYSESCVIRMRYNISTADFNFDFNTGEWSYNYPINSVDSPTRGTYKGTGNSFGWASQSSVQAGQLTSQYDSIDNNNENGEYPSRVPIWLSYGMNVSEVIDPNSPSSFYPNNNDATASQATRGYVFQNNPIVDIFGPLLGNIAPVLTQQSTNTDNNAYYTSSIGLYLAFNTAQFGRTFQDRTYVFAIRQRPPQLMGFLIHNLNVRGKRGDIVQVYPSVEHDFAPNIAVVNNGDLIHFQWQGSEYNNANNDGPPAGNAGTYDRNNAIILKNGDDAVSPFYPGQSGHPWGWPTEPGLDNSSSTVGHWGANVPGYIDDPVNYPFLGFGFLDLNALSFGGLNSSYFDLGPRQVSREGVYRYMCTTNNNYSNRSQKGMIVVMPASGPIEVANWGAGAFSQSADSSNNNQWTAGAYLSSQYLADGTPIVQQEVWLEAYDDSGYDTPWIKVTPPNITISLAAQNSNPQGVGMYLYIPHSFRVLTSPTVWYKANATTQSLLSVSGTTDDGYTTTIPIGGTVPNGWGNQMAPRANQGGYYTVQLSVNAAAIAGIVVGAVALCALFAYVYWKVRIQPAGGFQAWLKEKKALYDQSHTKLNEVPLIGETGTATGTAY